MGKFLEAEKPKQTEFKTTWECFSLQARAYGYYKSPRNMLKKIYSMKFGIL
jgi:hypothetical protein